MISLADLLLLLLELLGIRLAPPLAAAGGHVVPRQYLVALQNLRNAQREFNYWSGVCFHG